jgi:hypothetical protein
LRIGVHHRVGADFLYEANLHRDSPLSPTL